MLNKISLVLFIFCSICYGQVNSLSELIFKSKRSPELNHAQWSLSAKYVDNDETIIDYHSGQSLAPASGLKLVTTATALKLLGEDFTFSTKFYFNGSVSKSGVLDGNIFIVGGGDPTLGSDLVEGSLSLEQLGLKIITELKNFGIKQITGSVIADATIYKGMGIPRLWIWEDIGNYYGAQATALCLNDNLYKLFFKPANTAGRKAELIRTEPSVPNLKFLNYMKTGERGSGDNGYIFCAPGQYTAELRGTIPQGYNEFKIKGAIPDPPLFAAQHFTNLLKKNGIKVNREPMKLGQAKDYSAMKLLCEIISPPLKDIVYFINKKSYNLYAEMLVKAIGYYRGGTGDIVTGLDIIQKYLSQLGIDTTSIILYDGSGLSRSNALTTDAMSRLLCQTVSENHFNSFYNSLGVAGNRNDLSSFKRFGTGTAISNNARIKSGFVKGVRSHSGYLKDKRGRLIAFSFIANNFNCSTGVIDGIHKQILIGLAELE